MKNFTGKILRDRKTWAKILYVDPDIPLKAWVSAELKPSKDGRQWLWWIRQCPFCGRRHHHGGGRITEDPRRYLSDRVPHCSIKLPFGSKYYLTYTGPDPRSHHKHFRNPDD